MARRKKSSFKARTRTVTRFAKRSARRGGRSTVGGWLPLSMRDSTVAFGVGAIAPTLNSFTAPLIDPYLGWAGTYKDEVRTALMGVAAYKLGSGLIKDGGRELFRYALFSAGQETGAKFNIGTNNSNTGMAGVVIA